MKDISFLGKDLLQAFEQGKEIGKKNLAEDVLVMASIKAPFISGRLASSGLAYVDGKLVASTPDVRKSWAGPVFSHGTPSQEEDVVSFIFSTPKPASENANEYYEHGGRWFDYAEKVAKDNPWVREVIAKEFRTSLNKAFRQSWSNLK